MPLTILYAEDHRVVAQAVKETLELEGWRVVLCFDGGAALRRLVSEAVYDLLLFDNHPPNVNGLELVRYARTLKHRQTTPILLLSSETNAEEAYAAGVNAFLRKPQDVGQVIETIRRLLSGSS